MTDTDGARVLDRERPRIEEALTRALDAAGPLPPPLGPALEQGVLGGGKRIRPALCVAAFRASRDGAGTASDGDPVPPWVYDTAASLEMIHAYSLMHDDLPCMDDAPLRRGRPTPHMQYGVAETAWAAALLIPLAARQAWSGTRAGGVDEARARDVVRTLLEGSGFRGMVGGQALDLLGEGRRLDETELRHLHGWKTGALLTASVRMGGLLGGAAEATVEALTAFGRQVGLAFQIADDVLDATASTEELGKRPSDADLAKSTYVSLLGLDGARARGAEARAVAARALEAAGLSAPALEGLADYVLHRRR